MFNPIFSKNSFKKLIFENAPFIFLLSDLKLNKIILSCNQFEEVLGFNKGVFTDISIDSFKLLIHSDDLIDFDTYLNNFEIIDQNNKYHNCLIKMKDNKSNWQWFYIYGYPLKNNKIHNQQIIIHVLIHISTEVLNKVNLSKLLKIQNKIKSINTSVLTKREKELVKYITNGLTSKQIADKTYISVRTVETHRKNILKKLEIKNTAELTSFAFKNDLI